MAKAIQILSTILQLSVLCTLGASLSGCDELRTKMADLIAPQSPQDALKAVNGLVDSGQYKEARDKAVAMTDKPDAPLRGKFALAAARANAYLGDVDGAVRYLGIAVASLGMSPDEPMTDPAFQELRTNVQFLQAITALTSNRPVTSKPQQAPKPEGIESNAGGNTQIKMNASGTEVRAGEIVIKLPN